MMTPRALLLIVFLVGCVRLPGQVKSPIGGQRQESITCMALSPDGRTALLGASSGTVTVWDIRNRSSLRGFIAGNGGVTRCSLSETEVHVVVGRQLSVHTMAGKKISSVDFLHRYSSVSWTRDHQLVAVAHEDGIVRVYHTSGQQLREFSVGPGEQIAAMAMSFSGKLLAAAPHHGPLRVWDFRTAKEIANIPGPSAGVKNVAFCADESCVVHSTLDTVSAYEVRSAKKIWTTGMGNPLMALTSALGRTLWASTGQRLTPIDSLTGKAGRATVCDGDAKVSLDGSRALCDMRVVDLDTGTDIVRIPADTGLGIVNFLKPAEAPPPNPSSTNVERPVVLIKSPEDGSVIGSLRPVVSIYALDRRLGIQSIRLTVNGRAFGLDQARAISVTKNGAAAFQPGQNEVNLQVPVALREGDNQIDLVASNGRLEERRSVRLIVRSPTAGSTVPPTKPLAPKLWILAIGVNHYPAFPAQSLKYAAADARDIVATLEAQKGRLFSDVRSRIISDLSDIKPTREAIVNNLSFLKGASQHDVAVLFIAGHGVDDDNGNYQFLPSDARPDNQGGFLRSNVISWRELQEVLDIPARRLVLIDTCHSEGFGGGNATGSRAPDGEQLAQKIRSVGAVVFTSSGKNQRSYEQSEWGHGAFTYALLEGLSGKADLISDESATISIKELDVYVSRRVLDLTRNRQSPVTLAPNGYSDFPIASVRK